MRHPFPSPKLVLLPKMKTASPAAIPAGTLLRGSPNAKGRFDGFCLRAPELMSLCWESTPNFFRTYAARQFLARPSAMPIRCKFIAFTPQWDFLNFVAQRAARYPGLHLRMRAETTDLIEGSGRIAGLRAQTPAGCWRYALTSSLPLMAGARFLREKAGSKVRDLGAPMDVLWFRLSRRHHHQPIDSRFRAPRRHRLKV